LKAIWTIDSRLYLSRPAGALGRVGGFWLGRIEKEVEPL
jgi:hypothetical protein